MFLKRLFLAGAMERPVGEVLQGISERRRRLHLEEREDRAPSGRRWFQDDVSSGQRTVDHDHQTALLEPLSHLLRLVERLPPGDAEDHVRRSVYALIEAESEAVRRARANDLFTTTLHLQRTSAALAQRGEMQPDSVVNRLLDVLTQDVMPIVQRSQGVAARVPTDDVPCVAREGGRPRR